MKTAKQSCVVLSEGSDMDPGIRIPLQDIQGFIELLTLRVAK